MSQLATTQTPILCGLNHWCSLLLLPANCQPRFLTKRDVYVTAPCSVLALCTVVRRFVTRERSCSVAAISLLRLLAGCWISWTSRTFSLFVVSSRFLTFSANVTNITAGTLSSMKRTNFCSLTGSLILLKSCLEEASGFREYKHSDILTISRHQ